uniref:(northern house mosquito) hypothetical protein n=1 Tax=Culex pipiens TaxID=7175 RepID=A0A8D8HMB3_CULPI
MKIRRGKTWRRRRNRINSLFLLSERTRVHNNIQVTIARITLFTTKPHNRTSFRITHTHTLSKSGAVKVDADNYYALYQVSFYKLTTPTQTNTHTHLIYREYTRS